MNESFEEKNKYLKGLLNKIKDNKMDNKLGGHILCC